MVLREISKIDVNYVKKLYKEAFPIRERMPFSRLLKLQKNNIIKIMKKQLVLPLYSAEASVCLRNRF